MREETERWGRGDERGDERGRKRRDGGDERGGRRRDTNDRGHLAAGMFTCVSIVDDHTNMDVSTSYERHMSPY